MAVCVFLNVHKQMGHHLNLVDKSVKRKKKRKSPSVKHFLLRAVNLGTLDMCTCGCVCVLIVCVCVCMDISLTVSHMPCFLLMINLGCISRSQPRNLIYV